MRPADVLEGINRHFYESTAAERFATLFFGSDNDRTRRLRYINCAHVAPVLLRRSGAVDTLAPTAMMLGAFPRWKCREAQVELCPGDTLIMYSDGVTEAGMDKARSSATKGSSKSFAPITPSFAGALVETIVEQVAAFSGTARTDNVTVVALRGL